MVLLLYRPSNLQRMLLIIELATLVNHVGCLLMMQAKTAETALMAVKFSYIGKPYILLVIFLFLLSFYRVHIPNFIKYALCVFHVCISMLVLTCEHHRLFYSSMKFVDEIAQGILVVAPDERIIYENQQLRQIFASDGGFHEKKTYEILQKYCELGEQFSRDNHIYDIRKKEIEQNGIGYGNMYVDSNLLKHTKVQVVEADSGAACLEAVQNEHFDLIFLDHMMPEMDGVETLRRMRELTDNRCGAGVTAGKAVGERKDTRCCAAQPVRLPLEAGKRETDSRDRTAHHGMIIIESTFRELSIIMNEKRELHLRKFADAALFLLYLSVISLWISCSDFTSPFPCC